MALCATICTHVDALQPSDMSVSATISWHGKLFWWLLYCKVKLAASEYAALLSSCQIQQSDEVAIVERVTVVFQGEACGIKLASLLNFTRIPPSNEIDI